MNLSSTLSIIISAVGFFFFTCPRARIAFLFFQILILLFFYDEPLFIWISCVVIWFFVWSFDIFLEIRRENELQWTTLDYLNACILHLEGGFSLQNAMKESISAIQDNKKQIFEEIWQNLFQQKEKRGVRGNFFEKFYLELLFVAQTSQKTTEQIRKMRSQIKTELHFRRRSGQVLRSLRIQSVVMTIIYIAFVCILQLQLKIFDHFEIVLISFSLFLIGLFGMFKIGKDLKWKT